MVRRTAITHPAKKRLLLPHIAVTVSVLKRLAIWTVFAWLTGAILEPVTSFASFACAGAGLGTLPTIALVTALAPIRADVSLYSNDAFATLGMGAVLAFGGEEEPQYQMGTPSRSFVNPGDVVLTETSGLGSTGVIERGVQLVNTDLVPVSTGSI